jgi:large subunit ribosomal protein L22
MIRGKNVNEALAVLQFTNKRAAPLIEKCVRSAIANATEAAEKANVSVDPDDLFVKACFVDQGPTKNRRRVRPAPQGRAFREQRHFCHVTVLLSNEGRENVTASGKGTAGKKTNAGVKASAGAGRGRTRGSVVAGGGTGTARASSRAPQASETKTETAGASQTEVAGTETAQE